MGTEDRVIRVVHGLLTRQKKSTDGVTPETRLYAGGLGIDSLGAAEFSTLLEMEFGRDPYSEGAVPQTVGDVIRFYDGAADSR